MTLEQINQHISHALDGTAQAILPTKVAGEEVINHVKAVAPRGKQLRARLLTSTCQALGGNLESAVDAAAALELFQTAALVHDDLIDDSDTRRGFPAAHRSFATSHATQSWEGSSDVFGAASAILIGDLALMSAFRALRAGATAQGERHLQVVSLFIEMAELVTAGQYLDVRIAAAPISELGNQREDIERVMRSKTASYTAEFPLAMGAACAGASDETIAQLRGVGVPLGIAFQLRDDLLGIFGSSEVTGKPTGDDIREGKRTVVLAEAWQRSDQFGRDLLARTVANRQASDDDVHKVIELADSSGAREYVESLINQHGEFVVTELSSIGLREPFAADILSLVDTAIRREY